MNPHSIKFRLMALIFGLAGLAMLVRVLVAMPVTQDELERVAEAQHQAAVEYIARDIDASLRMRQALIHELAANLPPALLTQRPALEAWLGERQRLHPLLDAGLVVLPLDGQGVLADFPPVPGRSLLSFADAEWFQRALGSPRAVIGRPFRGRVGNDALLTVAAAVRGPDGKARAVLAGVSRLSASSLLGRLQHQTPGHSGSYTVIVPEGRLIVGATDPAQVLTTAPAAGQDAMLDRAISGFRGSGIAIGADGQEALSAVAAVPAANWFVMARIPTSESLSPMQAYRRFTFGVGLLVTAVLLVALVLMLPRVLRPLEEAARAMREMADGQRELAPLPADSKDEVGQMLDGFNHLVRRLRDKEAALEASEARMSYIAHHDSLTGLYNRAMLEDHLQHAIARAARGPYLFALLFIDLDGFKPVNDAHGHEVGDAVLCDVAHRLRQGRRRVDTVARQGGDEFVVLLADLDRGRADAEAIARQYLHDLARPYMVGELTLRLSASIGVAVYHGIALSGSQLLSRADTAMYAAKRAGKNQYCVYDEALDATLPQPGKV